MSKADESKRREQRLAAKLRENLKRRKGQLRARADGKNAAAGEAPAAELPGGLAGLHDDEQTPGLPQASD